MLDAYYCTTGGVVQGTSHPVQYSRACSGASSSRECGRRESTNPPWCLARSFPCTLCNEIRLAPARGTRTLTRTTRRKVNTRLRAVNGRPSPDNYRAAAFAGGIAEGAQDWLVIAPPPQSIVKSVTWSALDRHPASPCKLLPFLLRSESTSPLFLPAPIVKHFLTP
jgi:hypothetical protein